MLLSRCCCALALLSATVALPIKTYLDPNYPEGQLPPVEAHHSKDTHPVITTRSINNTTSEAIDNHYNSEAVRLVPDFHNLSEKKQRRWSDFYDCHPTRFDGRFINFSPEGICGDEEIAVISTNGEVDTKATNEAWREEHSAETLPQIEEIHATDSSQHGLARLRYQREPVDTGSSRPHIFSPEKLTHPPDIPPAELHSQKLKSRSENEHNPKLGVVGIQLQKSKLDVDSTSDPVTDSPQENAVVTNAVVTCAATDCWPYKDLSPLSMSVSETGLEERNPDVHNTSNLVINSPQDDIAQEGCVATDCMTNSDSSSISEKATHLQKRNFDVHTTSNSANDPPDNDITPDLALACVNNCMPQDANSYPDPYSDSDSDSSSDLDPGPEWKPDPFTFNPDSSSYPSSDYYPNIPDHAPSTWLHPPIERLVDKTTPITDPSYLRGPYDAPYANFTHEDTTEDYTPEGYTPEGYTPEDYTAPGIATQDYTTQERAFQDPPTLDPSNQDHTHNFTTNSTGSSVSGSDHGNAGKNCEEEFLKRVFEAKTGI